jgi:hypothetical protein
LAASDEKIFTWQYEWVELVISSSKQVQNMSNNDDNTRKLNDFETLLISGWSEHHWLLGDRRSGAVGMLGEYINTQADI